MVRTLDSESKGKSVSETDLFSLLLRAPVVLHFTAIITPHQLLGIAI